MKQFKSAGQAQRFPTICSKSVAIITAAEHRAARTQTFLVWAEISIIIDPRHLAMRISLTTVVKATLPSLLRHQR
jgi:hypothetical protein